MTNKAVANPNDCAEKYVDRAYQKAKNLARSYIRTHNNEYLDEQDYAQECMIAFLEGRNMRFGLIDAYRKAAPLSRRQLATMNVPIFWEIFEHTLIDEGAEDKLNHAVLLRRLSEFIALMEPIKKDVIDRYYFKHQTLDTIGHAHGKSRTWASNLIKKDIIPMLQKEFCHD